MAKAQDQAKYGSTNIFIANEIYPDAQGLFAVKIEALEHIKDDCIIVIDTNVLLLPYSTGRESLQRIGETFSQLVESGQLIVPGQVAREFAKNRATKLGELFQQITRKGNISKLQKGKYPLLESVEEYKKLVELEKEIDKKLSEYQDTITRLKDHIKAWSWDDPVSVLYAEMFKDETIFDPDFNRDDILRDLERRHAHNIPPGFKDSGKDDRGIGDLLVWHTILELAKERKKSVIFVTGDEKADWFHQSEKQALYPRFELVDEFRRASGGFSFHIVSFSKLLNLYGAKSDVVQEVRKQEAQERAVQKSSRASNDPLSFLSQAILVEELVYYWLTEKFFGASIERMYEGADQGVDFVVLDREKSVAVEVKYFSENRMVARSSLRMIMERLIQNVSFYEFDKLLLILVADSREGAIYLNTAAFDLSIYYESTNVEILFGFVTPEGVFAVL